MTHLEIRHLIPEDPDTDATQVAGIIATAFASLEVAEWLVPDPDERVRILTAQFTIFVEEALKQGEVLLGGHAPPGSVEVHAAAVWFRELAGPHSLPDDYDERLAQACGEHLDRFRRLDAAFVEHHPASYPHHCLTHLATLPAHQGCGLGTELLRYTHKQLDVAERPAYLVASNRQTCDLYSRHGYVRLGGSLRLPKGLRMFPMVREPQPLAAEASPEPSTVEAERR